MWSLPLALSERVKCAPVAGRCIQSSLDYRSDRATSPNGSILTLSLPL